MIGIFNDPRSRKLLDRMLAKRLLKLEEWDDSEPGHPWFWIVGKESKDVRVSLEVEGPRVIIREHHLPDDTISVIDIAEVETDVNRMVSNFRAERAFLVDVIVRA